MAFEIRVQERGSKRLRAAMAHLRKPKIDHVHRRALVRAGELVGESSRRKFLSGQALRVRSGRLQRSISLDTSQLPRWLDVGTPVVYAAVHELGWPAKSIPARPFLRSAAELEGRHLPEIWLEEIDRALGGART